MGRKLGRKLGRIGRFVTWLAFVAAMGFGGHQAWAARRTAQCDTPPGTCSENSDCDSPTCPMGGNCFSPSQIGCCVCFD